MDYRLCWRVSRIAGSSDPFEIGPHVPSQSSIARLAKAAIKKGASQEAADATIRAEEQFRMLVERHASERAFFDLMSGAISSAGPASMDLELKRAAYRANSQIYGRLMELSFWCVMITPGSTGALLHAASIRGGRGCQQLRPESQLSVIRTKESLSSEVPPAREQGCLGTPIGEDFAVGVGLLEEYSSADLLPQLTLKADNQMHEVLLATPDLGLNGSLDYTIGTYFRDAPVVSDGPTDQPRLQLRVRAGTPVALHVQDIFVHRSILDCTEAETDVFVVVDPQDPAGSDQSLAKLPIHESSRGLGSGIRGAHIAEFPQYTAMLGDVCKRLGWNPGEFQGFRCSVEYPVLNSLIQMRTNLTRSS